MYNLKAKRKKALRAFGLAAFAALFMAACNSADPASTAGTAELNDQTQVSVAARRPLNRFLAEYYVDGAGRTKNDAYRNMTSKAPCKVPAGFPPGTKPGDIGNFSDIEYKGFFYDKGLKRYTWWGVTAIVQCDYN